VVNDKPVISCMGTPNFFLQQQWRPCGEGVGIFCRAPAEFCWQGSFAGVSQNNLLVHLKIKMSQQTLTLIDYEHN
jgi:hypothetical protein